MRAFARLLTLMVLFMLAGFAAAGPAFAQKTYLREDLASDVVRLEEQIRKEAGSLTGPLAARVTDLEERLGDEPVHEIRERLSGAALADAFDDDREPGTADPASRRTRA